MTGKGRILLVDDDTDLLRLLSMRLDAAGYQVIASESAEQAMAHLAAQRPHLVITDLRMRGMDGMALLARIHHHNPALPVIILTAQGSIPDAVSATQLGAFAFLTKPFDGKALVAQIENALRLAGGNTDVVMDDAQWRRDIITRSPAMEELLSQARLVAGADVSVFIRGQSGTGKELLARAIHNASPRRDAPFVAVNCGAIPEPLLESELFGHTKGSFTGATQDYQGLFPSAHGGTLFLDEIGDMPPALQVKLLRVLEDKLVRPVGSTRSVAVDVRIISATHRDLATEAAAGNFREDLYYRLNVVTLEIPPLAERREDIPALAQHFLARLCAKHGKHIKGYSPEAMELLVGAAWPGNVRQLLNVIEQAVALCTTEIISTTLLQKAIRDEPGTVPPLAEARKHFERDYLAQLLRITNGNVTQAALLAKRNRTEFYKLLHRHALDPALFKVAPTPIGGGEK
jgi:two-component system response regulator GlrR